MSIRQLCTATTTFLLAGVALAAPAAAQVTLVAAPSGMTSGRLGPTLTALVALTAVAVGVLALRSPTYRTAVTALASGLISAIVGTLFARTAEGGPGTGNGIVGAWAAIALGLIAMILGATAIRSHRRGVRH
ncbi:DUF6223 family protein [Nocardia sp. NPDC051832]|uniref:DUF6223 family protein n=1 Tax=Nocardia sp. NPDC051832 TaxID=3155673 RepID=UPI0034233D43